MMKVRTERRDAQVDFALMLFGCAMAFWISVRVGMFTMPAEVYGPAVAIPAALWSGLILFANATWLFGLYINGRWRYSPVVRLLGVSGNLFFFSLFFATSAMAPVGDPLTIFNGGAGVLFAIRYLPINFRESVRAFKVR